LIFQDKQLFVRGLSGLLLGLALVAGAASARADEVAPDEESCSSKKAGDACADMSGKPGTCSSMKDGLGRDRLRCAESAAQTPPAAEKKNGCSVAAPGSGDDAALAFAVAGAAMILARSKRRASRPR